MTTYFVTRHCGAVQWANTHGITFDVHLEHLHSIDTLCSGDVIIGTLPINIISQVNEMGVRYVHLSLHIPPHLRGIELNAEQLNACDATLEEFHVSRLGRVFG